MSSTTQPVIPNRYRILTRSLEFLSALFVLSVWMVGEAGAVGVAAGTQIQNQASASYDVGGISFTTTSGINIVTVDEIIDVQVTLQSTSVPVNSPDTNQVLAYLVTNTGNGTEDFELSVTNLLSGDQFDPVLVSIWLDDGDGLFNPLLDTLYVVNANDPILDANDPANDSALIFVLNDIPGALTDANVGFSQLVATSVEMGSQVPGFTSVGTGDGGTDAVAGTSGAQDQDQGSYVVSSVLVSLVKTVTVLSDAIFGTQPVPGATLRYEITVSVTGSGTAQNVVISDAIPAGTIYQGGSLVLNGGGLSDSVDADAGDFNSSLADGITVDLGDVAGGALDNIVTFDVLIDPN